MEEQLVIIHDPSLEDELLLGVVRNVTKLEPLIRDRVRSPFVDSLRFLIKQYSCPSPQLPLGFMRR